MGCDYISHDHFQRQRLRRCRAAICGVRRTYWIQNKIETTDSDNRNRSPRLVVLHDYYIIALFRRVSLNDGGDFDGVVFLIQCRPANFAVETERDGVFS